MSILTTIKDAIWGIEDLTSTQTGDPLVEAYLGTDQAGTGFVPEVQPSALTMAPPSGAHPDPSAPRPDTHLATQNDEGGAYEAPFEK
jgi:hypothetical protein